MAKRGRPVKWEEAFKKYQSTARYYTNRARTQLNDRYIRDIDQFKEQVTSYREMYNWGVAKATSFLAQKASLNEASLNQISALQRTAALAGQNLSFKAAVGIFRSASDEEFSDIKKMVQANGWETEEELIDAVRSGDLTISELYKYLVTTIPSAAERKKWISQNIFGSN